jgi:hypothetical protein
MGYYVRTRDHDMVIRPDKLDEFFEIVKAMFQPEVVKSVGRGGSWGPDGKDKSWYSWVDSDRMLTMVGERSIEGVFHEWGFEDPEYDMDTGALSFWYDSKTGQESLFLTEIAPVVESGSYIEWSGEEGEIWRDMFDGTVMRQVDAQITFEFPPEDE